MIIITNLENVTFIQWETNHKFRDAYKRKRLPGYNFKRPPKPPKPKFKETILLYTRQLQTIYSIYPSAEITLKTPLMTGILKF